ncbi:MAG: hypothetical protein FWC89_06195 [Defluviitaleaceae bacterium]|nr:hypothetical protein [Defluviitaleaceae bacterium]
MSDFALSLVEIVVRSIVMVVVTSLTKQIISRFKGRTAPIDGRDGSERNK